MKFYQFKLFRARLLLASLCFIAMSSCTPDEGSAQDQTTKLSQSKVSNSTQKSITQQPLFIEQAVELGLKFQHYSGATDEHFFPEIMGSGGALFDFDGDGDLDVYLVQSNRINNQATLIFPMPGAPLRNQLFENRLIPDGKLSFVDVTESAQVGDTAYGMGVAVADVDNNGYQDIYVTNVGSNMLYLNQGDGRFTKGPNLINPEQDLWSTSASFLDFNLDGNLDLFVAQYVHIDMDNSIQCSGYAGNDDYCTPDIYRPTADLLLIGDGTGALKPVSNWQHNRVKPKTGLGVVAADYDLNGTTDLYVANDKKGNLLWLNRGDGSFEESAVMNGAAYNSNGKEEASMGVTSADIDGDGDEDLFLTHLKGETNTLYTNLGNAVFIDSTINFRLSNDSLPSTGFGTRWFDMDNDADLDLFTANGAVMQEATQVGKSLYPYYQHNQLFENRGDSTFIDVSKRAGLHDIPMTVSRGAALGDIDNDGDVDVLVTNNNGPVELLINQNQQLNALNWLTVRLQTGSSNRDGIGSRIGVERGDGKMLWRRVATDGSYLSASDLRTHFGLGKDSAVKTMQVNWHSGEKERFTINVVNQHLTFLKGEGTPVH